MATYYLANLAKSLYFRYAISISRYGEDSLGMLHWSLALSYEVSHLTLGIAIGRSQ